MLRVHYHSDSPFFGGSENMLVTLFTSPEFERHITPTFSYRYSKTYENGLKSRLESPPVLYPLHFYNLSPVKEGYDNSPSLIRRVIYIFFRLTLKYPMFIWEVWILRRLFKKLNPNILHINNGGYPAAKSALAAAVAGRLAGITTIIMIVNNMAIGYEHYERWFDWPIDFFVKRSVNLFITGSQSAADRVRVVLNLPNFRVKSIHNGVALRSGGNWRTTSGHRFGLSDFNGVILGVVALLVPRKGHAVLLESLLILKKANAITQQNFALFIEGDGPLRDSLELYVQEHNLSDLVRFIGRESDVIGFINALDCLILPSIRDEDFPNVILEAMALSKPVISSKLAGTPEQIMDNITGLLVPPGDPVELASAILRLMKKSPHKRRVMGAEAKKRFDNTFTAEIAVKKYLNLYNDLVGK